MGKRDNNKAALKWLFAQTKGQRGAAAFVLAGSLIYASCAAFFALMCRGLIDGATGGSARDMTVYGAGLAAAIILQIAAQFSVNSVSERLHARIEINLRGRILAALLGKETSAAARYHSGELLNRIFSDAALAADAITVVVPSCVNMAAKIIFAAAVLAFLDARFTLAFAAAGFAVFAAALFLRGRIKGLHKAVQEADGTARSFLQEAVENLLPIKVFGAERKMLQKNAEKQEAFFKVRMKRRTFTVLAGTGFNLAFRAGYAAALIWGAAGILLGNVSYGTLTAMLQLVGQIQSPFANLSSLLPRFYGAVASAERIMELEALPDEPPAEKTLSYADLKGISFDNADFAYGENRVLKGVSFDIEKGEFVSLTGISGGGKSTLFLLLLGAYSPQTGSVKFRAGSGEYSAGRETRGLFAYVPQGNALFSGTIRENITLLNDSAPQAEIEAAAKTACALDFIKALPRGFDTEIGENGFGLSEGQAQRIAIARAILSGAPILLLDEATSALDEATEAELLDNLSRISGKTVLIVTHRRAALAICQKRLSLKGGSIEVG